MSLEPPLSNMSWLLVSSLHQPPSNKSCPIVQRTSIPFSHPVRATKPSPASCGSYRSDMATKPKSAVPPPISSTIFGYAGSVCLTHSTDVILLRSAGLIAPFRREPDPTNSAQYLATCLLTRRRVSRLPIPLFLWWEIFLRRPGIPSDRIFNIVP